MPWVEIRKSSRTPAPCLLRWYLQIRELMFDDVQCAYVVMCHGADLQI